MWSPRTEALSAYVDAQTVRLRRWRRGALVEELSWDVADARAGAAEAAAAVGERRSAVRRLAVFVAGSQLRLGVLDRLPGVRTPDDWRALAAQALLADAGLDASEWLVQCDPLPGRKALAAAVERGVVEALALAGRRVHGIAASIQPWSLTCLRLCARRDRALACLTVGEGDAITGFVERSGEIRALVRRCGGAEALAAERRRIALAAGGQPVRHVERAERPPEGVPAFDFTDLLREVAA